LGRNQPKGERGGKAGGQRKSDAVSAADRRAAQSAFTKAETALTRHAAEVERLDQAILAASNQPGANMQALLTERALAATALAEAEEVWLAAGAALEA
jgi:ATP-binding cassette subfamily F protein 3